ncbi:type IV secretory system conjugative DNA transfer family protein [Pectinatus frisingensis]|uniref:type IV secretory system conjugative DNA transfer family protein n=1 Tax=Pectinatus frisingensis TaxID=865 RepID=UPI0018C59233|nr:type IV secretion system DNA-binding domain-containing protein [Pectinatus frisingensis]
MANYEAENEFLFNFRKMIALIGRGLRIGIAIQFILCILILCTTSFYTVSNEKISPKITMKYFLAYAYPDYPKNRSEVLEVETLLGEYAHSFDKRLSKNTEVLSGSWYQALVDYMSGGIYTHMMFLMKMSFLAYLFSLLYIYCFIQKSKSQPKEKYMRGSKIMSKKDFDKYCLAKSEGKGIRIGTMIIPDNMVTRHILILGTTGTGKSVLINQMIDQIRKQQANVMLKKIPKLLFYDIKGEFVQKHYQQGDVIFNPFDNRCVHWSIFNEFTTEPELDAISKALFIPASNKNAFFYDGAAAIFRAGLLYLIKAKKTTNSDLWDFFASDAKTIAQAIKTLPKSEHEALKFLSSDGGETSADVLATLMQRISFFKNLRDLDGDFSFREWAKSSTRQNVFLLNSAEYQKAFAPLMTLVMDLVCRTMLSMPDDENRRTYFVLDEIGSLDKMDSLISLETIGRSKGVSLICASQDFGQIAEKYGKDNLQTFVNNFNTNFYFRLNDAKTAKEIADSIGKQQIKRKAENHSISIEDSRTNKSNSEQEHTEYLVMPEELQQLDVGTAYCRISGSSISKIKIPQKYMSDKNEAFVPRVFSSLFNEQNIEENKDNNGQESKVETTVKFREFKV